MERILEVCTVFGNGRIQLKKKVRTMLELSDGDDLYFKLAIDGRIYLEKADSLKEGSGKYTKIGT